MALAKKAVKKGQKRTKTGAIVKKDPKKMRTAKKAAHALKGKPKSAAHIAKIRKAALLRYKTGKKADGTPALKPGPKSGNGVGTTLKAWAALKGKKVTKPAAKKTTGKKPGRPAKVTKPAAKKPGRPAKATKPAAKKPGRPAKKTGKRRAM